MAPTRELAIQIETETKKIAKYAGIKVVCVVGGVSIQEQGALSERVVISSLQLLDVCWTVCRIDTSCSESVQLHRTGRGF